MQQKGCVKEGLFSIPHHVPDIHAHSTQLQTILRFHCLTNTPVCLLLLTLLSFFSSFAIRIKATGVFVHIGKSLSRAVLLKLA